MGLSNNLGKLSNMITSTGSAVGIAQSSPSYTLDVSGTGRFTGAAYFGTTSGNIGLGTTTIDTSGGLYTCVTVDSSTYSRYSLQSSGVAKGRLQFDATNVSLVATSTGGKLQLQTLGANAIELATNDTLRMTITSAGNVGIGYIGYSQTRLTVRGVDSSTSNYAFRVENAATSGIIEIRNDGQISTNLGTGTVYSTGGVLSVVSDMNLKIEDGFIDNALEKVLKLKPRYFHWKEESKLPNDLRQLGFYAQEVNEALGEEAANTPKENEYFGINDRAIIAYLAKAIQEMNTKLDEQNQTIQNLQEQNQDLKSRLDKAGL